VRILEAGLHGAILVYIIRSKNR